MRELKRIVHIQHDAQCQVAPPRGVRELKHNNDGDTPLDYGRTPSRGARVETVWYMSMYMVARVAPPRGVRELKPKQQMELMMIEKVAPPRGVRELKPVLVPAAKRRE